MNPIRKTVMFTEAEGTMDDFHKAHSTLFEEFQGMNTEAQAVGIDSVSLSTTLAGGVVRYSAVTIISIVD